MWEGEQDGEEEEEEVEEGGNDVARRRMGDNSSQRKWYASPSNECESVCSLCCIHREHGNNQAETVNFTFSCIKVNKLIFVVSCSLLYSY